MAGDPGLAEELGNCWEAPGQPYLWASVLNLFWRHKKIGHQEEHVLSLESKRQGWPLLPSPKRRDQNWHLSLGKSVLARTHHQLCPRKVSPGRPVEAVIRGWGGGGSGHFESPALPL